MARENRFIIPAAEIARRISTERHHDDLYPEIDQPALIYAWITENEIGEIIGHTSENQRTIREDFSEWAQRPTFYDPCDGRIGGYPRNMLDLWLIDADISRDTRFGILVPQVFIAGQWYTDHTIAMVAAIHAFAGFENGDELLRIECLSEDMRIRLRGLLGIPVLVESRNIPPEHRNIAYEVLEVLEGGPVQF